MDIVQLYLTSQYLKLDRECRVGSTLVQNIFIQRQKFNNLNNVYIQCDDTTLASRIVIRFYFLLFYICINTSRNKKNNNYCLLVELKDYEHYFENNKVNKIKIKRKNKKITADQIS